MADAGWPRKEDFDRVYRDMYLGNGKPAVTIRMELMERRIGGLEDWRKEHVEDMRWFKRLMIGTIISAVASGAATVIITILSHAK